MFVLTELKHHIYNTLLSSTLFFKGFISLKFIGPRNLKNTHCIEEKRRKDKFSNDFSIHKRKEFSKDVNEH